MNAHDITRTHLRCIATDDESFSVGSVYKIIEDNCSYNPTSYIIRGDDDCTWCITKDTLEFVGCPEIGRFEIAYVGDSVQASDPTSKSEPEFGEIVHVNGSPYVFISIDEDGDHHLINSKGIEVFIDLVDIDEYAHKASAIKLRNLILTDIKKFCNNSLEDHMTSVVNFNIPELIDFIMMYKDNWEL